MLNKTILAVTLFLVMVNLGAATVSINETVGEFRISFEGGENTSFIVKGWNLQNSGEFREFNDTFPGAEILGVGTLDILDPPGEISVVGVIILNKSVNTTDAEMELLKASSRSYIRVYDRTIDGHKGIYVIQGDGPDDTDMESMGQYWLNEAEDGTATELILIMNGGLSESAMMTVLNTVHVEKLVDYQLAPLYKGYLGPMGPVTRPMI